MAIITISRGTLTGGKALAECLEKKLGYPCVSRKEVLTATRKLYDIPEEELNAAIDKPPPFWLQVTSRRIALLKCITDVLLGYIKEGNLIYHGHAGHLLLSGISNVISIRVIASIAFRMKAAKELYNLEGDAAMALIEKKDNDRSKWARFFYGVDVADPHIYDVTFNLKRTGIEDICRLIVLMTTFNQYKMTAESVTELEDFSLATKVWANLAKDKDTQTAGINVTADRGIVHITGKVSSKKMIDRLTQIASQVKGVKELKNDTGIGTDWYW
jgi:cytidylate kinase